MNTNPERPVDTFVKRSMEALSKEYLVIGKTRVSRLTAWTALAFFLGMTLTIGFLASRTGTFETGEAARAPRTPKPVWSSWSKAQEGNCEGKTSDTQQCREAKAKDTVIDEKGKTKKITVAGFQTRSCQKNCETLAGAQSGQQGQQNQQGFSSGNWVPITGSARSSDTDGKSGHFEIIDNFIYAFGKTGGGVFKWNRDISNTNPSDGSWEPVTGGGGADVFKRGGPNNKFYILGENGGVYRWDGGDTGWTQVTGDGARTSKLNSNHSGHFEVFNNFIYVLGGGGNIAKWNRVITDPNPLGPGSGWENVVDSGAVDVFKFGPDGRLYAMGGIGGVYRWDGGDTGWTQVTGDAARTSDNFGKSGHFEIINEPLPQGGTGDFIYALGQSGNIARWSKSITDANPLSGRWENLVDSGAVDVFKKGPDGNFYALSENGRVSRWNEQKRQFSGTDSDQIKVDYRYIRDYFTPQVTGFQFHKELKNVFCIGDGSENNPYCVIRLCPSDSGKCIRLESHDKTTKQIVFRVPKTDTRYYLYLFDNYFADQKNLGKVLYKICPTDKTKRCYEKMRLEGTGNRNMEDPFKHSANQDQTIQIFGFDFDAPIEFLTGKYSVRFYGDAAPYVIPIPTSPLTIGWDIYKAWNFPKYHATMASLDIRDQMPVNAIIAMNCKENPMVFHTNATPGSMLARKTEEVFDLFFNKALRGMFAYRIDHGSGLTVADIPTKFSGSGCTKNGRCGENGTNDIVFVYDQNLKAYDNLTVDSGLPNGIGAAALYYGATGSKGYNDVAMLVAEMDILVNIPGIDFNNPEHAKIFKALISHELSHLFTGRGANNMLEFDIDGNPFVPAGPFKMINDAYSHPSCDPVNPPIVCNPATENCYGSGQECKAIPPGQVGDACHPKLSVEQQPY